MAGWWIIFAETPVSSTNKTGLIYWCLMPTLAVFQLYCGVYIKHKVAY
jgi:hypothetical protein